MQEDDVSILPKVGLKDIPEKLNIPKGKKSSNKTLPNTSFEQGTNGLIYQQIISELPNLGSNIEVLPYFTSCLTELGIGKKDYLETQELQSRICGSINAYTTVRGKVDDVQNVRGIFTVSAKALARNQKPLTDLVYDTLNHPRFDEHKRIKELFAQMTTQQEQSITGSGHTLAMAAACSGMSPAAELSHRLSGLSGIQQLKKLNASLKNKSKLEALSEQFHEIHQAILNAPKQSLLISDGNVKEEFEKTLSEKWSKFEKNDNGSFDAFTLDKTHQQIKQIWSAETQINFCAKAYPTVPIEHPDAAPLHVLGRFLTHGYIHGALRERGGAYGGGASYDSSIAAFRFYSYRDPRLQETLKDFDESIKWLHNNKHAWEKVEEAILGVISAIDQPSSPAGEAKQAFHNNLFGRTEAERNRARNAIIEVTLDDLIRVAEKYLSEPESASIAIITNPSVIKKVGNLDLEVHKV